MAPANMLRLEFDIPCLVEGEVVLLQTTDTEVCSSAQHISASYGKINHSSVQIVQESRALMGTYAECTGCQALCAHHRDGQ